MRLKVQRQITHDEDTHKTGKYEDSRSNININYDELNYVIKSLLQLAD